MRVAPEGWPFIIGAWVIAAALAAFGAWIPFAVWLPVAIWVVAFFRDPEKPWKQGEDLVIAPADGRIVDVRQVEERSFMGGTAWRVSIFMNVFDCHVNRYPADGTVTYRHYNPGRFINAADEKASTENEQSTVGLETPRGKVLIRQIAGLIARRIITDHQPGTAVRQGQRLGMIRFGSRVDVFLPASATVLVHPGERTQVGLTVLARWS